MTASPHDALFKAAFEHREHAEGLLRGILPPSICSAVDWTTLTLESGAFVDPKLHPRHTDLLFRAALPEHATSIYFYILAEHRSALENDIARRMLGYAMHHWDRHRKQHPTGPLPVVFPVLVCHVDGGWTDPTSMQALFDPAPDAIPGLARFVPHFDLLIEDLALRNNEELRKLSLAAFPMLALWLLRDAREPDRLFANFPHWVDAWAAILRAPSGAEAFIQLLSYISWVCSDEHADQFRENICKQLPEAEDTVMKHAEKLIEQGRTEGLSQGRTEGLTEGRTEVLEKLLTLKFGAVPPSYLDQLEHATLDRLDRYIARVLSADSLEAVFAD